MLEIGAIVWGVTDIDRAVSFWCQALDYQLKYPAEAEFAILVPKQGVGIQLSLNRVCSPAAKRHHLDLFTQDVTTEVERLKGLGATLKAWCYEEDAGYIVMQDPEGNPFCVIGP